MTADPVQEVFKLDFQWPSFDPFLFCAFHKDRYPRGDSRFGPSEGLGGRELGSDFTLKNGYRMYHGDVVPGFPVHPHRGFETVTIVRQGLIDHADSMGAAGRYGNGDVQWMTAASGVQHSEMFPLLDSEADNPLELFQVWLNLPAKSKMVAPHFKMFWSEQVPYYHTPDGLAFVEVVAGSCHGVRSLEPPPDSWAADPAHAVEIWVIQLREGGRLELPVCAAADEVSAGVGPIRRTLYYYEGDSLQLNGKPIAPMTGMRVDPRAAIALTTAGAGREAKLLLLQGRPIAEPVVQYGPFVMNTQEEIRRAFSDYRKTQFGGWPWDRDGVVHGGRERGRFAKFPDGTLVSPALPEGRTIS